MPTMITEASSKSAVIGSFKKGELFTVLEDKKIIEEIGENIAPMVKVKSGFLGSKTGYVFGSGSFISGPYELEK